MNNQDGSNPASDLFSVLLATCRLIPKIGPTEHDTFDTAAERLKFVAALRGLAKRCSIGLVGTPVEQSIAREEAVRVMQELIDALDVAMLMRAPSPSAGLH